MMTCLLALGIAGIFTSTVYGVLVVVGALRLSRRRREELSANFAPPVTLLKPLHGLEPDLEANLQTFFEQNYPRFEIIFCARADQDPGLAVARIVAARYPDVPCQFLSSGTPGYANAKVWSLEQMQSAATHDFFVISDSDVSVAPNYLRAVMSPFTDDKVGVVTCLYRGIAGNSIWANLEAVGMSVEMSAGVLVAEMLEGMKFALGPTMVVRRTALQEIGGFHALGPYHADDFVLGNLISAGGHQVVLSTHPIEHHVLNTAFVPSILHQIRWMKSTRFSRPKGHLGTALTFGMPYGLLAAGAAAALHHPWLGALLLFWIWASRAALGATVGRLAVGEARLLRLALLYPLRDCLGFFYWAASYVSNQVKWRGEVYNLMPAGFMKSNSQSSKREREAVLTS